MNDEIKKLAEDHWSYVKGVLETQNNFATCVNDCLMEAVVEVIGHHYKTAFIHGFKHGIENSQINSKKAV